MNRGGARRGAGRPKGSGKYKEPTQAIRLPISIVQSLHRFLHSNTSFKLPFYIGKIPAGFPSPAEDYVTESLDLNEYLIKHPAATFLVRATGNSMVEAGIFENDILIVDRSIMPTPGKIVIAAIDGQLTVKRFNKQKDGKCILLPANSDYKPIEVNDENQLYIWGVVVHIIHSV